MLTPTPLLVVRTEPKGRYEKVLVGLDLGPTSRRALETALKAAPTADFLILHANEIDVSDSGLHDKINNIARHCFAAARREVGFLEGAIEIRVESGSVGDVMQRNARRFKPDLVAFGKHNKGVTAGPHLGTGARAILENLDADMLVTMSVAISTPLLSSRATVAVNWRLPATNVARSPCGALTSFNRRAVRFGFSGEGAWLSLLW